MFIVCIMLNSELLNILVCPTTHQPVREAPAEILSLLNQFVNKRQLKNAQGNLVEIPLEAGLLREDGRVLYPIYHEIPIMLQEEAIEIPKV